MVPTEYRAYEVGIEVARRSATVYAVGVASTKYITEYCSILYKMGMEPTKIISSA